MIRLEGVSVRFGARAVLDEIAVEFAERKRTVLLGSSGSGKSTLLRLINRLIEPSAGRVWFGERAAEDIPGQELRRAIGFVPQGLGLFPHWTARKHLERFHRHSQTVEALAASLGLEAHQLERYPHQLSGGQQQRVALGRALAPDPPVLLLDEPFSALDPVLRKEMQDLILKLDKTIAFVTHDIREALRLGDRIVFLSGGQIAYDDTATSIHASPHAEVQAFLRTLDG